MVWALIFVRALGLGPGAGVLALAVTYGGMLGKVYTENLESGDTRSARALLEAGSPRIVGMREGRVMFDRPVGEVDQAMLQALYA